MTNIISPLVAIARKETARVIAASFLVTLCLLLDDCWNCLTPGREGLGWPLILSDNRLRLSNLSAEILCGIGSFAFTVIDRLGFRVGVSSENPCTAISRTRGGVRSNLRGWVQFRLMPSVMRHAPIRSRVNCGSLSARKRVGTGQGRDACACHPGVESARLPLLRLISFACRGYPSPGRYPGLHTDIVKPAGREEKN